LHPNESAFTFFHNHRKFGYTVSKGERIDYIIVSKNLEQGIRSCNIHSDIDGFTHCPMTLTFEP